MVTTAPKIIVTGASGFLGRALMDCLRERGLPALGVSRRYFLNTHQVLRYEDTPPGNVLVHLAEASDRTYVQAHAPHYEQQALALLKALQIKGFSRIIYASSAVVYGDQSQSPRKVSDAVYETDAYTRLKLASERLVLKKNGVAVRLANLYGPGMAETNVVSTILRQLPQGGPIRVFDDSPTRDFLWVEDAARALADMAVGKICGLFNVGSGKAISINELAARVLAVAGQTGRKVESTTHTKRLSSLLVDIERTQAVFGWRPAVTLTQGIATLLQINASKELYE
jgi:UDP-glucose 4-epimerase